MEVWLNDWNSPTSSDDTQPPPLESANTGGGGGEIDVVWKDIVVDVVHRVDRIERRTSLCCLFCISYALLTLAMYLFRLYFP
ncbi:UNVERIFIED_CONTAM: hypothetical protein Slati_1931100 [Sesamum latifolium]|uniref:Uncharacterized protein n=1 Tax=Sesamum latifolium TaxID=2727402 RepID=A0AAW2X1E2_9LAMI